MMRTVCSVCAEFMPPMVTAVLLQVSRKTLFEAPDFEARTGSEPQSRQADNRSIVNSCSGLRDRFIQRFLVRLRGRVRQSPSLPFFSAAKIASKFVGGLAGKFVGVGVGLHVNVSDVANRARRRAGHHQQQARSDRTSSCPVHLMSAMCQRLDDRKRPAVEATPFHCAGGRVEQAEPGLGSRLLGRRAAGAAVRSRADRLR